MLRTSLNTNRPRGRANNPEHLAVAREIGREGVVLLKNEDNFFPLDPNTDLTIAVIGENATKMMTLGGGSSELKVRHEVSPLEGLKERYPNATFLSSPAMPQVHFTISGSSHQAWTLTLS